MSSPGDIEFRVWDKAAKKMYTPGCIDAMASKIDPRKVPMFWSSENREVLWMEYTRRLDKEGVRIFEGDYLRLPGGWTGLVQRSERLPVLEDGESVTGFVCVGRGTCLRVQSWADALVIGNDCENPELRLLGV
jgi:hypothetical protein